MKKRFILLMIPLIFLTSACSNDNTNVNNYDKTKYIEIVDNELGLKTTFSHDDNIGYSKAEKIIDDDGELSIEFDNDDLDIEINMNYILTTTDLYNSVKESHKNDLNYEEYLFDTYKGYTYGSSSDELELFIVLDEDKTTKECVTLYAIVSRLDQDNKIIVKDVFEGKELQALFDTTKFERFEVEDKDENDEDNKEETE